MPCKCQDRDVWEVCAELRQAAADPRLPLTFRNLAKLAAEHLERLDGRATVGA